MAKVLTEILDTCLEGVKQNMDGQTGGSHVIHIMIGDGFNTNDNAANAAIRQSLIRASGQGVQRSAAARVGRARRQSKQCTQSS